MKLQVEQLCYQYNEHSKISNISLYADRGEFVGVVGPNGSGKSTLLKNLYRALEADKGKIFLDGEDYLKFSTKKASQKVGVVGQEQQVPFDFRVHEIVAMGRSPYKKWFELDSKEDQRVIQQALDYVNIGHLSMHDYSELSGGEKQRVMIARVIAQQTDFLILDEPTNHLDIQHQLQLFDLFKQLNVTVISSIHDLNLAALYCDRIYVMLNGEIYCAGHPEEVLTQEVLRQVFGIEAHIDVNTLTGKLNITYLPAHLNI